MAKQTKSLLKLKGIIVGKDNPKGNNGYKTGTTASGKPYRSIKFGLKTAPDNVVNPEMFGMVKEFAIIYSKDEKKSIKIPWDLRYSPESKKEGYELIVPEYDLVEKIDKDFKDGDTVFIVGEIQFYTYEKDGQQVPNKRFAIKQIYKSDKPLDFDAEDFVEENEFQQEIIINEVDVDREEQKLLISAYTVDYTGKATPALLELDGKTQKPSFVNNMKGLKFGDFIKVTGIVHNRQLTETIEVDEGWGLQPQVSTSWKNALEILGADPTSLQKGLYKEEDLFSPEQYFQEETKKMTEGTPKSKPQQEKMPWE